MEKSDVAELIQKSIKYAVDGCREYHNLDPSGTIAATPKRFKDRKTGELRYRFVIEINDEFAVCTWIIDPLPLVEWFVQQHEKDGLNLTPNHTGDFILKALFNYQLSTYLASIEAPVAAYLKTGSFTYKERLEHFDEVTSLRKEFMGLSSGRGNKKILSDSAESNAIKRVFEYLPRFLEVNFYRKVYCRQWESDRRSRNQAISNAAWADYWKQIALDRFPDCSQDALLAFVDLDRRRRNHISAACTQVAPLYNYQPRTLERKFRQVYGKLIKEVNKEIS